MKQFCACYRHAPERNKEPTHTSAACGVAACHAFFCPLPTLHAAHWQATQMQAHRAIIDLPKRCTADPSQAAKKANTQAEAK